MKNSECRFIAHILETSEKPQCLIKHLTGVAEKAYKFCKIFDWKDWIYTAGILHDIGKYKDEFQEYVRLEDEKEKRKKHGKIDHSTAGAKESVLLYGEQIGKLIAYAIAGHHSGLPDGKSDERSCLEWRLTKNNTKIGDYSAYKSEITEIPELNNEDIKWLIRSGNNKATAFAVSFFIRMLFSCLVDADRLDAEFFEHPENKNLRENYPSLTEINEKLDDYLLQLSQKASDSPINMRRAQILKDCRRAAEYKPGLFSLTVPTGGGKTLSSLAFALKHAIKYNLKRVIYVIPYTSIIEQNANVFRDALGDLRYAVIEHHSNFDREKLSGDELERYELAAENWDAPIIITTNVQFFESLFSHRPSQCRKLHNIMNSVVILDEAQALPVNLLQPCIESLRELTDHYNTTVVLCTATQPALEKPDLITGLENVREIIEDRVKLYEDEVFKRVDVDILGKLPNEELAEKIRKHKQVLCIVNTRRQARELYKLIEDEPNAYHLSALMCPEHRSQVIAKIKENLANGEKCRVISTQLIEAGVDIDFPVVYRAIAGIDSIAQAAGRCNREGKLANRGKLYVFETEKLPPPGYLRQTAQKGQEILRKCQSEKMDIFSLEAVREYFALYYWSRSSVENNGLDEKKIIENLSDDFKRLNFPFRKIGTSFKLIEDRYIPVIIPFDKKCRQIIDNLKKPDFSDWESLRKLQRYTVSIPKKEHNSIRHNLELLHERYFVLINKSLYDNELGLKTDDPTYMKTESTIT